jgi:hypothetical protein
VKIPLDTVTMMMMMTDDEWRDGYAKCRTVRYCNNDDDELSELFERGVARVGGEGLEKGFDEGVRLGG